MLRAPSKYRNSPTVVDGVTFASKAEARRYSELKLSEKAGQIASLKVHPEFYLEVNGVQICKYVGDFGYYANGRYVLEDVKGVRTAVYQLKKRLMLACLAIPIVEVPVRSATWTRRSPRRKRKS